MQLYHLYRCLCDKIQLPGSSSSITKLDIEQEIIAHIEIHKKILAQQRLNFFNSDNPNPYDAQNVLFHKKYHEMLEVINAKLLDDVPYNEALLLLEFIMASDSSDKEDAIKLFSHLVETDIELVYKYYQGLMQQLANTPNLESCSVEIKNFAVIYVDFALILTEHYLDFFTLKLSLQESAYPIMPCISSYADKVEAFAALIIWLKEKGVSDEELIYANILQDFVLYNICDESNALIQTIRNPVKLLYAILEKIDITQSLAHKATFIRCNSRGFHQYCLDGTISGEEIQPVIIQDEEEISARLASEMLNFTVNSDNFHALYTIFNLPVLRILLSWAHQTRFQNRHALTNALLNVAITDIDNLVYSLVDEGNAAYLQLLASLLQDEVINNLVDNNSGALLYLFAYLSNANKRIFARKVNEDIAKAFLNEMTFRNIEIGDVRNEIEAIFSSALPNRIMSFLFSELLDLALITPKYLNENLFIACYFDGKEKIIEEKILEADSMFWVLMWEQTSLLPFTQDNYHTIVDIWDYVKPKITFIKNISPPDEMTKTRCPNDIYILQATIIKILVEQHKDNFTIDMCLEIMDSIFLSYDNTKLNILAIVDDATIRERMLSEMDLNQTDFRSLFMLAIRTGNVGFLHWLDDYFHNEVDNYYKAGIDRTMIVKSLIESAECGSWDSTYFICEKFLHIINRADKAKIFLLATASNKCEFLPLLYRYRDKPNHNVIQESFLKAVKNEYIEIFPLFSQMNFLSDNLIVMAFNQAIGDKQYYILNQLACLKTNNRLLQKVVEDELVKAVDGDDAGLVSALLNIEDYYVANAAVCKALKKSYEKRNLQLIGILENYQIFKATQENMFFSPINTAIEEEKSNFTYSP